MFSSLLQLPSASDTELKSDQEIVQCVAPEELNISFSAYCENSVESLLPFLNSKNSPLTKISTATVSVQTTDDLSVKNSSSTHLIAGAVSGVLLLLLFALFFIRKRVNNDLIDLLDNKIVTLRKKISKSHLLWCLAIQSWWLKF